MVKDESEVDVLKRRVDYLQEEHVILGREHRDEMESKNVILIKRQKRIEKLERDTTSLKREQYNLQTSLRASNDRIDISGLEIGHLEREVKRLCEAKQRVRDLEEAVAVSPNAKLRLKIKQLLLKYHPDHRVSKTTHNNEEVTRDLVDLLEQ